MRNIRVFIRIFILWTLVGMVSKIMFLLAYRSLFAEASATELMQVFTSGLRLDIAIAGYLTLIPGLLLVINLWSGGKMLSWIWKTYFSITAFLYALAIISNLGLYGYWGFPLDNTPLLYVRTSPADAMASMTAMQIILASIGILLLTAVIYGIFALATKSVRSKCRCWSFEGFILSNIALLCLTALLILPIRGGVGTGTNHTGSVYFSSIIRVNHAAVNPVFSFVESALHQEEIGSRYRFMEDAEATELFKKMTHTASRNVDSAKKYNVILISLESFSDTIMHINGVTPHLNAIAREGLHFTNFYANSFRTDRALVAIHSGLPAQPTMSVMDMPRKSTSLPSIAGTLAENGYTTTFYYGGDINYSNMRSYFVGTGFQHIVSDTDFPKKMHTGKWGVADGPVYDRMLNDIKSDNSGEPFFRSIMTESSHEPFDVPNYNKIKTSPELNAFAYADECLGNFITELKKLPCWQNTLVVITPDHLGAYPANADNYQLWRFHVPLILTGGVTDRAKTELQQHTSVIGSQIDIAATILGILGIDHSKFTYSKDLSDASAPHFAFYTFPDAMGMIASDGCMIYDNIQNKVHSAKGSATENLTKAAKAYLQKLYDDLDNR